ncbi:MATE family efflux transporter [Desulfovibrio gilichinskyi]|uniref:Multidrug-efflux transporter n=1 Tax=Desulfovibrio gilichinskyi TaxID=1519643 RepID=A0A1X7C6Z3_9BACT|nr:MATE family efflux transporter [Desulfovibrio gilichinskyi]SME91134.1 putative efflux protein, MATE family [Desulfovibrio gilichinskyi]
MNMTTADMTNSPYKTIWNLSWPQILMMFFHLTIGLVDVWVAGKLGREIQASMGMVSQSLFFFLVIGMAVANGSVAAISQSIGAGRMLRAKRYIGLCFQLGAVLGIIIFAVGYPLRDGMLTILRVPPEMRHVMQYFIKIFLYLLPLYYLLIITNAIFRAQKKVLLPLYSMVIVTILNTILDLGLGLGLWGLPDMGYRGVALATFYSISAGAIFNVFLLYKLGALRKKSFAPLKWCRKAFPYLFKVAWPSGLMQLVWHSGYLVLYSITASLSTDNVIALAGMAAGIKIESIIFLPAFAFNMTASIIIGHYLGDGKPEEAKKFGYRILGLGILFLSLLALGIWPYIRPITALIAPDKVVLDEAVNYLFYNVLAIPFTLTSMIMAGALNGAGATLYNLFIFSFTIWGLRLPLAYYLGHQVMHSATGIWIAMLISQIVQASIIFYVFSRCDWQRFSMSSNKKRIKHG